MSDFILTMLQDHTAKLGFPLRNKAPSAFRAQPFFCTGRMNTFQAHFVTLLCNHKMLLSKSVINCLSLSLSWDIALFTNSNEEARILRQQNGRQPPSI